MTCCITIDHNIISLSLYTYESLSLSICTYVCVYIYIYIHRSCDVSCAGFPGVHVPSAPMVAPLDTLLRTGDHIL